MSYLKEKYIKEVRPTMVKKFNYTSKMEAPLLKKVVVNCGFGRLVAGQKTKDEQKKTVQAISRDLSQICGQKSVLTKARKSISSFKIREGQEIGCKVTLRRSRMWDFLERLINITLPRSRDFQGIPDKNIDSFGNLTIGIRENICFPEISPEKINFIFGFEITVVSTAKNREEGLELFRALGFPIQTPKK